MKDLAFEETVKTLRSLHSMCVVLVTFNVLLIIMSGFILGVLVGGR